MLKINLSGCRRAIVIGDVLGAVGNCDSNQKV